MNKKVLKTTSLSALAMLLGATAANAAVPVNTVIVGDKAYSIDYLMDSKNTDEISAQVAKGGNIYYKFTGESTWTNVFDSATKLSDADLAKTLPTVTYFAATGAAGSSVKVDDSVVAGFAVQTITAENADGTKVVVADGATIRPSAKLTFKFNAKLDDSTVSRANIKLYDGQAIVSGTVAVDADDNTLLRFTPDSLLSADKSFKLVISKDVKSDTEALKSDVIFNFKTVASPVIDRITGIKQNTLAFSNGSNFSSSTISKVFTIPYNKDLDLSTLNTANIKLYNATDKTYVALSSVSYADSKTIQVTLPGTDLTLNKKYQITISNVKGLDGSDAEARTITFTRGTAIQPGIVTPFVSPDLTPDNTNIYPSLKSSNTRLGFNLLMTVSGDLDSTTVNTDTVYIEEVNTEKVVDATVSYDAAAGTITVKPTSDLKEKTDYKIVVDGVKDIIGIKATAPSISTFTTGDFTAPTVVSASVADGSSVALDTKIEINFSEAVAPSSFTYSTSKKLDGGSSVVLYDLTGDAGKSLSGKVSFKNDNKTAVVTLDSAVLTKGHSYKLMLGGKNISGYPTIKDGDVTNQNALASDFALNFYYESDTVKPTVKEVDAKYADGTKYVLTDGATNVSEAGDVKILFNDTDLLSTGTATWDLGSGTAVRVYDLTSGTNSYVTSTGAVTVTDDADGDYITIDNTVFTAGHRYRIDLTSDVADIYGNKMSAVSYAYTFGTRSTVAMTTPVSRTAAAVDGDVTLTVTTAAGLNLDTNTLNSTNVKVVKVSDGSVVNGTLSYDASTGVITFDPTDDLAAGADYNVAITTGLKDTDGNSVLRLGTLKPSTTNFTFKTAAGNPAFASATVNDGDINVDGLKPLKVTFDAALAGLTTSNIYLTQNGSPVVGPTLAASTDNKTYTLTINSALTKYTDYELNVRYTFDSTHSINKTIHFTTGNDATDVIKPKLSSTGTIAWGGNTAVNKLDNATYDFSSTAASVTVNFTEEIDADDAVVTIQDISTADSPVVGVLPLEVVNGSGTNTALKITTGVDLNAGTKTYKVTIKGVKDVADTANVADDVVFYIK